MGMPSSLQSLSPTVTKSFGLVTIYCRLFSAAFSISGSIQSRREILGDGPEHVARSSIMAMVSCYLFHVHHSTPILQIVHGIKTLRFWILISHAETDRILFQLWTKLWNLFLIRWYDCHHGEVLIHCLRDIIDVESLLLPLSLQTSAMIPFWSFSNDCNCFHFTAPFYLSLLPL